MKKSMFIKNGKEVANVGDLKSILEKYPDDTGLAARTGNAITDLYISITHPIGDRDTEEQILLIFGGNEEH